MIAQVARAYRVHWRTLLLAGVVVFVPLGVLEVLAEHLQEPLADEDLGELDAGLAVALCAALIGLVGGTLLGEVVYTGLVSALVHGHEEGSEVSIGVAVRHLPIGRLIVIDLLWVALVIAGFIALIVPGFIVLTWFALVAPAAELEGRGVRDSFRRSRELVRRRFWLVFAFGIVLFGLQGVLADGAAAIASWALGDGFGGEWLAAVLAGLAISPLFALVAVVLFLRLRERDPAPV